MAYRTRSREIDESIEYTVKNLMFYMNPELAEELNIDENERVRDFFSKWSHK